MIKWLIVCCAFVSCQKSPTEQGKISLQEKTMQEKEWRDGMEVFFVLHNQELMQVQRQTPEGFYVKGIIVGGQFMPKTTVLGVGDLAQSGRYGWLELNTKEFFPMESPKKALTPFVKGYMTNNGFVPSSREVFSEP